METFEGQTDERPSEVRPIAFLEDKQVPCLPAPLVRVNCCGMMTLEVLKEVVSTDPPLGRYEVVSTQVLRGRGAVPSMMLLKLLGSQPHRFATKDWLITQMQQEMESGALVRLDTVASQLRKQFRGLQGDDASALGLVLVAYLRNGRGSGPGYQLAPYPLIWLDTDALAWNAEQAARMERFGHPDSALVFWQRANALASRGTYLPDDPYSEWATNKREVVEGAFRQSVHALSRLSLSLYGQAGEEEVMGLLRSYWLSHKTDEDALRPLMELLGRHERYQEAEAYYQQLCEALDVIERGKQPDDRTRDLREFLRTRQIQRKRVEVPTTNVMEEANNGRGNTTLAARLLTSSSAPILPSSEYDSPRDFSYTAIQGIIEVANTSEEIVQQSGTQDMESSRRNFLQTLGVLGAELFLSPQLQSDHSFSESHSPDFSKASVSNLATITQQFRAMQRRGDVFITNGVHSHIQTIQEALEQTVNDSIRRELWKVLAQTQTVAGFNPSKKTERGRAKTFLEAAIASAQNSGDTLLTGASLGHLAQFALREEHNLTKAMQLLHHAQEYVEGTHPLNGWFALVMASIAAKGGQKQQCEAYLTEAMTVAHHLAQLSDATDLYFTDFNLTSIHIYTINCWLTISDAKKAYSHLAEINLEDVADNRRASAFCDASKACMMVGEFEMGQQFAFQAIDKATSTQQRYVIPRCMTLAQTIRQKVPETPYTAAIIDYARFALQH